MSSPRDTLVPVEHLMAELSALPISSAASLQTSTILLDVSLNGATGQLWRDTERDLVNTFPSFSLDELVSHRDWLWFDNTDKHKRSEVYLSQYLQRVAQATMSFSGNVFRPELPPWATEKSIGSSTSTDAQARRFWRWVSFSLPSDLLMAAHPSAQGNSNQIELVSPLLSRILHDHGYVEPHMHVGAAIDFPLLWISTLHALAMENIVSADSFYSPGAELNEGKELSHWLIRSAISRYLMGLFINLEKKGKYSSFDDFLFEEIFPKLSEGAIYSYPAAKPLILNALRELAGGRINTTTKFSVLQRLYSKITSIKKCWPNFPEDLDEAYQADPLQNIFPVHRQRQYSTEMQFISASLDYLRRKGNKHDPSFPHLFWQYTRVRNLYYRHVVQRPLIPGLQWFVRFFDRLWPGRAPISLGLGVRSAANICNYRHGLRSMEFRTTPKATQSEMISTVKESISAINYLEKSKNKINCQPVEHNHHDKTQTIDRTEYGMILHFSRNRGGGMYEGKPKAHGYDGHADPSYTKNLGFRFGRFYREKRQEALTLSKMFQNFPRTLSVVRGIDLCTDEVGVPMWSMAPLFRYIREVSQSASAYLQTNWGEDIPSIRMTAHAGEEFLHLLGGLRRIDETIDLLNLGQGDRLGHAIALGVNPTLWAERSGGIAITKMERLFDLAWEWSFSTTRSINLSANRLQYIIDQIEQLSNDIFEEYADPTQVSKFVQLLGDEEELRHINFPHGPLPDIETYLRERREDTTDQKDPLSQINIMSNNAADNRDRESTKKLRAEMQQLYNILPSMFKIRQGDEPWRLLAHYFLDIGTFNRGQELILVDPTFEAESLKILQNELRRKVGTLGITVEINPSSNLLVGNLADLENHPLWRLKPPRESKDSFPVDVSIGSDDPLTFSTRTQEEYQLIYDTLMLAGLTDAESRKWVDDARQSGLISRFTLASIPSEEKIWTAMNVDINHIKPLL